jgi:hypothetical protein
MAMFHLDGNLELTILPDSSKVLYVAEKCLWE